jgi:hypothetical protein
MALASYDISPTFKKPEFKGAWNGPVWEKAGILEIGHYRPESSDHRPRTQAKLLYGHDAIYGLFRVEDQFVRCVHRRHQDPVYKDSCVEFFIQPCSGEGYFNFEFNCGGTLLASYVTDPLRTDNELAGFTRLSKSDVRGITIYHSQPKIIDPEITEPVIWYLEFAIPYRLLEQYAGAVEISADALWRGNLYKCADETSHPHWASWSPVDVLNFHLPHCFGNFAFAPYGSSL